MDIVKALGGEKWFNLYAAIHLFCLILIATSLLIIALNG